MPHDLLFEIGCEEIPARFLPPALEQLAEKAAKALDDARVGRGEIRTMGTPRRLTLIVADVAEMQEGREEKRLGPFVKQAFDDKGEPTKAALGFARSLGADMSELGREETPKGEKLLFCRSVAGKPSAEVLAELLPALVGSLEFPKSMRWGSGAMAFVRPIHWLLAILGGEPLAFSLAGIEAGNKSRGHRFTHPDEFEVPDATSYEALLLERGVVADPAERRSRIEAGIAEKVRELGAEVLPDPGLLGEVSNLVEFPVVISGSFKDKFLDLPPQAPISCMRTHQRYFAVSGDGSESGLLPRFITVANTPARDMGVVARGNERVLEARLEDAEFYWREDKKTGIEKMYEDTRGMLFHKTLGSYRDKTGRLEGLAGALAEELFPDDSALLETAVKAARYCKADLVSNMVGEFAELQGVMGSEYALAGGMSREVAAAIRDHYLPRSAEDIQSGTFPETPAGDIVSICDKIDSVAACWAAGLAPTGSGDPFALRRQAQGVTNLALAKGYRFNLARLAERAAAAPAELLGKDPAGLANEVLDFFLARLKAQLIDQGKPRDVADACLAVFDGDLVALLAKVDAVTEMKKRPDFDDLMVAFRRVMNIVEGDPGAVDSQLFDEESEAVLYSEYTRVDHRVRPLLESGDYKSALDYMAGIKPAVDRFFDNVMVNVDDPEQRRNRHALCALVADIFRNVADFSKIVIEGEKSAAPPGG